MTFVDEDDPDTVEEERLKRENIKAVLVLFSVTDRSSYHEADRMCSELCKRSIQVPIVLVANKIDLVRKRVIHLNGK